MKHVKRLALAVLVAALVAPAAWSQGGKYTPDQNSQITGGPKHSTMSKNPNDPTNKNWNTDSAAADQQFLKDAAQSGLAEVQLGQLAEQKAADPAVKQFGQRMVQDHGKANDQLKSLASSKGVQLPTTLQPKDQQKKDQLANLSGQQFDQEYMQTMVLDHQKDVMRFQKEAGGAKAGDVKKFASDTLPTLKSHLQEAQKLEQQQNK